MYLQELNHKFCFLIKMSLFISYSVLFCAVFCCVVLCCAVLCCVVLCRVVLCCVVLCRVVLCCIVPCCVVLCCVVLCIYLTLFRDYFVKQKFAKLIVCDAPATRLRHAVWRTAHAYRDGERRPHATETGKLYRLPTETKNVYVVLSAVQERLCLCLQAEHTHTHPHTLSS